MTRYLLDTNIISDLLRRPKGKVAQHIAKVGEAALCTSIIVAAELRFGAVKSRSAALASRLDAVLARIPVLPLDRPTDAQYADIRAGLETSGQVIGPNDLLIAAHACAAGATIVTANTAEFTRIPGLPVENWLT